MGGGLFWLAFFYFKGGGGLAKTGYEGGRFFQIVLRGGGKLEILLGGIFFLLGKGELHKECFPSFKAFVMLQLIFQIYGTSVNENWHQTLI